MPAPVFKASPRLPTISIAPGLWAVLFMFTQTAAADVLVVTDSRHPVQVTCPLPPYQSNVGSPGLKG